MTLQQDLDTSLKNCTLLRLSDWNNENMKIDPCFLITLFLKIKPYNKLTIQVKPHLLQTATLQMHRDHY